MRLSLRSAAETYTLIQSLLDYNDLDSKPTIPTLRTAQETYDLIQGLLPSEVVLRSAAETYTLIQSLLDYNDLDNRPVIPVLRDAAGTYALIQSLLDYQDLDNKPTILSELEVNGLISNAIPDISKTTQIYNANVSVTSPGQWISLGGTDVPISAQGDWVLVNVDVDDWVVVSVSKIRSLTAGTVGAEAAQDGRVAFYSPDIVNVLYFGRTSDNDFLFTTGDVDDDDVAFSPEPLVIRRVDKT